MTTPGFDLMAAVKAGARAHYIEDHIDVAGFDAGLAWDDMGGSEPSDERALLEIAMQAAIDAALPYLLAEKDAEIERLRVVFAALETLVVWWPKDDDNAAALLVALDVVLTRATA